MNIISCPWCHIKPRIEYEHGLYWIVHTESDAPKCPISTPDGEVMGHRGYESREAAIEAWNSYYEHK